MSQTVEGGPAVLAPLRAALLATGRRRGSVDELTGLGGRDALERRGRALLAHGRRTGCTVALLLVDLDDFARVGLEHTGHPADGDAVLVEAAVRLTGLLGRDDLVARLGRDEFVVLTSPLASPQAALALAGRVLDTLGRPVEVAGGSTVRLTASVGVALLDHDGASVDDLLRAAGRALFAAKSTGGDAVGRVPRTPTAHAVAAPCRPARRQPPAPAPSGPRSWVRSARLATDLRRAVERRELGVHYQPRLDARTGLVAGFEALVRWEHPEHGLLMPRQVLPLAERARLLGPLGDAVAERALEDLHHLRTLAPGASLSVNVCARRRGGRGLVEGLARRVEASGHDPADVVLDLTEDAPTADASLHGVLARAHHAGLRVSVRGFGRASSGLRQLWASPAVREVRIDPTTVASLVRDPSAQRQVRGLVGAARDLDVAIVAEGVETEDALAALLRLDVDGLQGRWLGEPLDLDGLDGAARHWPGLREAVRR